MRYLPTIVWGVILGQVVGFLIGALSGSSYDPKTSAIVSVIFVVILFFFPPIMQHFAKSAENQNIKQSAPNM